MNADTLPINHNRLPFCTAPKLTTVEAHRLHWRTLSATYKPGEMRVLAEGMLQRFEIDPTEATPYEWTNAAQEVYNDRASVYNAYYNGRNS
ncbi:MAG: hypothetical protein CMA72_09780 [Euryarchaeota archaeon]|nr:hypothetical protein [Euryarchaeota archaeon]|tara:strand:- start:539 stop:811 length:273 start_codon:yes stop_codon:yes gene_type:complete